MVQILPQLAPKRNIWGEIGAGLGTGLGEGLESSTQHREKQSQQHAVEQLLGKEFASLPPKMQEEAAKQLFKTRGKLDLMKQLGLDFTPEEENVSQSQNTAKIPQSQIEEVEEEPKISGISKPKLIPQSRIDKMSLVNPSLANQWQKSNEEKLKQYRLDQKLARDADIERNRDVRESFKENQKFLEKMDSDFESTLRKEAILDRMHQLEDSDQLSDSGAINFLHQIGFRDEWLKNPANEEYTKLGLDLLGGGTLQSDYGSRVLASEFKVSQQRIPTLSQTPEGRRQIRENLEAMLLPNKLKNERLQFYLDKQEVTGKPLPHNLQGKILKDIKPQLEEAYDKFKQRNGRYKVKKGTIPDDNAIEKYYYLADGNVDKADELMKEDGYDISGQEPTKSKNSSNKSIPKPGKPFRRSEPNRESEIRRAFS